MIEIIKRIDGEKAEKQQIKGNNIQISLNDWGHLAVRIIQDKTVLDEENCEYGYIAQKTIPADTLVVFNREVTNRLINFCKDRINRLPQQAVVAIENIEKAIAKAEGREKE